jgi:hypothetical protein
MRHVWDKGEEHKRFQREDLGIDERMILNILEAGRGDMDWIDLAQDTDRRWALVNAVMNFQIP